MNRAVSILLQLESADSVAKDALAMRCGVAARTISTDVAQLNNSLGTAASIRFSDGRYRLLIVDADCRPLHAIEFQGTGHHLSQETAARDAVKKEALRRAGIGFFEVVSGDTPAQVKDKVRKLVARVGV